MEELKDQTSFIHALLEEADQVYEIETEGEIDAHATYMKEKEALMKAGVPYHEWPGNGLPRKGEK
jgi:predicted ABC-type exoprotein transport system permease subunit